ncbi:hypothetical protein ACQJBY_014393 [Aegilops geniculata]
MAISKSDASFACWAVLMLVMATLMLSCDADPKESCDLIEDGCNEAQCRDYCRIIGHTKGSCREAEYCCCLIAAKPKVDVGHRHRD